MYSGLSLSVDTTLEWYRFEVRGLCSINFYLFLSVSCTYK